jgi:CRISPR-associated protein Csb2
MKPVRPTVLPDDNGVHYVWPLQEPVAEQVQGHLEAICQLALNIFAVGWGIDVAVASAQVLTDRQADALSGEKWIPAMGACRDGLRVPKEGTLDQLVRRHAQFVARLGQEGLSAPLPVSAYCVVEYRSACSGRSRPIAAFSLLKPDATGFRAFDPVQRTSRLVEMVRGATERSAKRAGWPESKISTAIMGHGEVRGSSKHSPVESGRFAWLPLPSLEMRREGRARVVSGVRRIIVTSFDDELDDEIAWARRALSGEELTFASNGSTEALLSLLPESDLMVRQYVHSATTWATVTPVVLPGYDDPDHYRIRLREGEIGANEQKRLLDRIAQRIDGLLRKAIMHCGLSQALAEHASIEWRGNAFWPGSELASRYAVPDHLRRFPRLHVKISWRDGNDLPVAIPGPICIGGGRFYGLGLFAAVGE